MTKRELFDVLADVPDESPVSIKGSNIRVVTYHPKCGKVMLDSKMFRYMSGDLRILFNSTKLECHLHIQVLYCPSRDVPHQRLGDAETLEAALQIRNEHMREHDNRMSDYTIYPMYEMRPRGSIALRFPCD